MIELYTSPTPNGYKISVALEELDIPYNVHVVNLQSGDQKKPEFLELNPLPTAISLLPFLLIDEASEYFS